MTTHSDKALALWTTRLEPLFKPLEKPLEGDSELTIGEGLTMPSAQQALDHEASRSLLVQELKNSMEWICRIVKPELLDIIAFKDLIGVRKALLGLDAILGIAGKTPDGKPIQVAISESRVHLRTRMPAELVDASPIKGAHQAILFGTKILNVDDDWIKGSWQVENFLNLGLAYQMVEFIGHWPMSCCILTDGSAVKFSFLKIFNRTSPPSRESGLRKIGPWFPPERKKKQKKQKK